MDDRPLLTAIEAVSRAGSEVDGAEPLDEGAWRRLRHHADELDVTVVDGQGFAVVDADLLHLVVHPDHRRHGLGRRLLDAALLAHPEVRHAWSHGDHPAAAALARRTGFDRVRELWVMRRPLDGLGAARPVPPGFELRRFRTGDEAELLRVNAAAFAHHREQGSMDAAELAERMAEAWFDPDDLIVAVDATAMRGFHWTKRHSASMGEVYVVAIDPQAQGGGLGRALVDAGLEHLRSLGLCEVILYVESDNLPAVRLYQGVGFGHAAADTHVMYERGAGPGGAISGSAS